jgi:membrane protein YdbS with pleckstrin-like domain
VSEPVLLPHEYRIITLRRHPVVLARPAAEAVAGLGLGCWLTIASTLPPAIIWLAAGVVLVRSAWKLACWAAWSLVVSNLRMLITSGLLTRQTSQVPLIRIIDMTFERDVAGQFFGYGTMSLKSAAHDHAFHEITHLPKPEQLYRLLSSLVFRDIALEGEQTQ